MVNKVIYLREGKKKKEKPYYYHDTFDTWDDAKLTGEDIKKDRKEEKVKYFVLKTEDSWFLPVTKYVLYLSKKLKIL